MRLRLALTDFRVFDSGFRPCSRTSRPFPFSTGSTTSENGRHSVTQLSHANLFALNFSSCTASCNVVVPRPQVVGFPPVGPVDHLQTLTQFQFWFYEFKFSVSEPCSLRLHRKNAAGIQHSLHDTTQKKVLFVVATPSRFSLGRCLHMLLQKMAGCASCDTFLNPALAWHFSHLLAGRHCPNVPHEPSSHGLAHQHETRLG